MNSLARIFILSLFVFSCVARGQSLISQSKIHTLSLEQQLDMINYFQMDCLKLIRPPSDILQKIEIYRGSYGKSLQMRIVGQTKDSSEISIGNDPFVFENDKGEKRLVKFDPKDLEVVGDENGGFTIAFSISDAKKIVIPVVVSQGIQIKYDLYIDLNNDGKIKKALAVPLTKFEIKKQFCPRSRFSVGAGASLYNYSQSFSAVSGELTNGSTSTPAFFLEANIRRTPNKNIFVLASSAVGKAFTQNYFMSDLSYRWNSLEVIEERRKQDWIFEVKERIVHPFYRYGFQFHSVPVIKLITADQGTSENFQYLNASGGFGLSVYSGSRLSVTTYLDLQYPVYSNPAIQYGLMFGGAVEGSYAFSRSWFGGFNWHGQGHSFNFSRSDSLDRGGKMSILQSSLNLTLGYIF